MEPWLMNFLPVFDIIYIMRSAEYYAEFGFGQLTA